MTSFIEGRDGAAGKPDMAEMLPMVPLAALPGENNNK